MDHCSTLLQYSRAMLEYSPAMLQYSGSIRLYSRSMIQYSGDGDASWRWIMDKDGWMMKTDEGDTGRINTGASILLHCYSILVLCYSILAVYDCIVAL